MMLPRIVVVLALRVLVRRKGGLLFLAKRRVTAPLRTNKPLKFPERPQSGLIFKSIYHSEKLEPNSIEQVAPFASVRMNVNNIK